MSLNNEPLTGKSQDADKSNHINLLGKFFREQNIFIIFAIIFIVSAITSPAFLTSRNITNVLRQLAVLGVIGMGALMVIITGGIDLSVGSIVCLTNVVVGKLLEVKGYSILSTVIITLLIGAACGLASGYLVAYRKVVPFVTTLSIMTIAKGLSYVVSRGTSIYIRNEKVLDFGNKYWLGIPRPVYITIIVIILTHILLKYTVLGRMFYAIGSNEEAVRLAGIKVNNYKFLAYAISGFLAGVAGFINIARTAYSSPLVGDGLELDAIAVVVIGGASLSGGKGNVGKTVIGVLIIGIISNIMNLLSISAFYQMVVKGVIIILAVLFQDTKDK
jgi:ribose transport system permease protein